MASVTYEEARSSNTAHMAGVVEFTFPAFDALPEKKLYFGTKQLEADGNEYVAALPEMVLVRGQRGPGQDTADFQINDSNGAVYDEIKDYEDVLEDTQVVIKECLKTSLGIYETETTLTGAVEALTLSDSSMQLNLSVVSDMSRTGFLIGGRILAARYCAALFNINGLRDPEFDACGWQVDQGGNPIFCSHKKLGTDGCFEHGNLWRFLAIEALTTAEVTLSPGGTGWGYGGGGGPCFHPLTEVWMADNSFKPIYQVGRDDVVWATDEEGNLVKAPVGASEKKLADLSMITDFGRDRKLGVTAEHAMKILKDTYRCIGSIDVGQTVMGWKQGALGHLTDFVLHGDELCQTRTRTHNFWVPGYQNYHVRVGDLLLNVSNSKPVETGDYWGIDTPRN
jgi:hypothetical protein